MAVFAREEAETSISCPEIPFDRRVCYAFELLAGVRTGEAAALRWRHYDPTKKHPRRRGSGRGKLANFGGTDVPGSSLP